MKKNYKMSIFKKKKLKKLKRLEDCPYIKTCAFKGILYPCEDGGYTECSIYLSNEESKTKEEGEEK